eukprot:TRINITY_DN1316_c0_g1_i4.p1 TRINITY_DN1316_c0_g1~~TRINITY_DN1316_c0_g1_i4.p1  ORF type:complete len:274 (+),score=52.33 TRINITY_DN1316_c0_g1_i4:886-1707(+)
MKIHGAAAGNQWNGYDLNESQNKKILENCKTFVLTPGSCLYAPAGFWHKVVSESDETGSLSINFSLYSPRHVDLLTSGLVQYLWSNPGWRDPVHVDPKKGSQSTREAFAKLLKELPDIISKLSVDDFLPESLATGSTVPHVVVHSDEKAVSEAEKIESSCEFKFNPLAILQSGPKLGIPTSANLDVQIEVDETLLPYSLHIGIGNVESVDNLHVWLHVLPVCENVMFILLKWKDQNKNFTLQELLEEEKQTDENEIKKLLYVLCFNGFIHRIV